MAGFNNVNLENASKELMRVDRPDDGTLSLSSESISGKVELPSENADDLMISERQAIVDYKKLSLTEIFENRENVLATFIGAKGCPSPILEALRIANPNNAAKLQNLIKVCAPKEDLEMIHKYEEMIANQEYDKAFGQAQLELLDNKQLKIYQRARKLIMRIMSETKLSLFQVLYEMSFSILQKDPLEFSKLVLKFNKLRRSANHILKQKGEESISLSDAFLASQAFRVEFVHREGNYIFCSNRNLVMVPYECQVAISGLHLPYVVHLPNCSLAEFPEFVLGHHLSELSLEGNLLNHVPDAFQNCVELSGLNLSETMIADLPDSLFSLPELQDLKLVNTALTRLPERLDQLPTVRTADDYTLNRLALIDVTGSPIHLDRAQKKIVYKLVKLRTEIRGVELPVRAKLKIKKQSMSLMAHLSEL